MQAPFCIRDNNFIVYNVHFDNPDRVEEWKNTLTEHDVQVFNQGRLAAYSEVLGQLRESKIKLLNRICELDEEGAPKKSVFQMQERIRILDVYDKYYSDLVEHISKRIDYPVLLTPIEEEYA